MTYRQLLIALLLLASLTGADAVAQSFEDGRRAYINGEYQKAYDILKPLAESGDSEAQKMIGIMYDYGHGVDGDKQEAMEWYLKSAQQGQPAVQNHVALKYFRGDGVARDHAEAAKWWERAANGGHAEAQFNLGLMYFRGISVARDNERAAELFRLAAEQGDPQAQYSLGYMYAFGQGVEKDYDAALEWYNKAAEQGVAQAQYNVGVFYENGYSVDRDIEEAKNWYERAASQGLEEADTRLAELEKAGAHAAEPPAVVKAGQTAQRADTESETPPAPDAAPGPDAGSADGGIRREAWLLEQPADSYTLQIGSVTEEQAIVDFIRDNGLEMDSAYIEVVIDGVTRYNGLYGNFSSYGEAEQAAGRLASSIGIKPWVRNIGLLQEMIQ